MMHGKATVNAIELSALRQPELLPLIVSLGRLDLRAFVYVSVHAPSTAQNFRTAILTTTLVFLWFLSGTPPSSALPVGHVHLPNAGGSDPPVGRYGCGRQVDKPTSVRGK